MIYVDDPKYPFRGQMYCHMMTDGPMEELHTFAARLGLQREWAQKEGTVYEHYDLSPSYRRKAVSAGATETTGPGMVKACVWTKRQAQHAQTEASL